MSRKKPEDQTAYYQEHPPKCIADFLLQPIWLDNIEFDGHGVSGRFPDGLLANPDVIFAVKCKCGAGIHNITASSELEEIWRYKNQVIAERYFLECGSCRSRHLLFDKYLHGYNAETSQMEGLDLREIVGADQSPRQLEEMTYHCSSCRNTAFEIFTRFEYPSDLFDEPLFAGNEHELFSWFTGIGKCSACSTINLFVEYESA